MSKCINVKVTVKVKVNAKVLPPYTTERNITQQEQTRKRSRSKVNTKNNGS